MAKWRLYAAKEFPKVVRALALPAARSRPDLTTCPLHNTPIGAVTCLCEVCWRSAWDEVGRRYALASQGAGGKERR